MSGETYLFFGGRRKSKSNGVQRQNYGRLKNVSDELDNEKAGETSKKPSSELMEPSPITPFVATCRDPDPQKRR